MNYSSAIQNFCSFLGIGLGIGRARQIRDQPLPWKPFLPPPVAPNALILWNVSTPGGPSPNTPITSFEQYKHPTLSRLDNLQLIQKNLYQITTLNILFRRILQKYNILGRVGLSLVKDFWCTFLDTFPFSISGTSRVFW